MLEALNLEEIILGIAKEEISDDMNEFSGEVFEEVKINTPKKTGELESNNKLIKSTPNNLEAEIVNDTDYGIYVDKGVKNKVFNYRRDGVVIKTGVGSGFMSDSFDKIYKG